MLNEIHSPSYIKGKYATPAYPQGHAFRLYFATGTTWAGGSSGDEENWRLKEGVTDLGSVASIVDSVFDRLETVLPATTAITEIELWSAADGANILQHLNTLPTGNSYGAGAGVASAYYMEVYAGALREPFRFTVFDGQTVKPQKFPPGSPPLSDDGSLVWYMLRSPIPFATNDGVRLAVQKSINHGYNRKLSRSYGRTVSP